VANLINWKGRLGPMSLELSPNTFAPTTISLVVAESMRIAPGDVVIDVGCGSGIQGIIAAKLGASHVHSVDFSPDVVAVGAGNAASNDVADQMTFYQGDVFAPIPEDVEADVIIGDVSGIPDEFAATSGWFPSKIGGGPHGSELPIRMLREAKPRLKPNGLLLLPTGTLQDEAAILEVARDVYGGVKQVAERVIPFPTDLAKSPAVKALLDQGVIKIIPRRSRFVWEARIWECTLAPGS
jgi:methylase of polypeptide subunit release factors